MCLIARIVSTIMSPMNLEFEFQKLDADNDGFLTVSDLEEYLPENEHGCILELMQEFQGKINFDDFKQAMLN